ncbi:CBS domain-containing protein [Streptomyces zhihengii]
MTLVQMQPRSANANPVHRTVDEGRETAGPEVCDDMTVEVALAVMASARARHLVVRDQDGLCTGLVSQAGLATLRDSEAYTDQIRLRDLRGDRGPLAPPMTAMAEAENAMRHHGLSALPAVDGQSGTRGVIALAH